MRLHTPYIAILSLLLIAVLVLFSIPNTANANSFHFRVCPGSGCSVKCALFTPCCTTASGYVGCYFNGVCSSSNTCLASAPTTAPTTSTTSTTTSTTTIQYCTFGTMYVSGSACTVQCGKSGECDVAVSCATGIPISGVCTVPGTENCIPIGCTPVAPTSTTTIVFGGGTFSSANLGSATNAICAVYTTVESIIFILGLTLMILGGALYAGGHILPGQQRGPVLGYGMGMILGGVVGVIIALAAPYMLSLITGYSLSSITSVCVT